jgi:pimeloyl-ACP methyl ester carboxylesterase
VLTWPRVSGYNDPQAQIQLAILQQLTSLLRAGKYTGVLGVPGKLVHVGHSFGSFLSNALVATTPELSDAAILTGIAYGSASMTFIEAWGLRIATQIAPGRWNNRDNGYLTWVDAFGNAAVFFYPGSYDTEVLWYTEDVKQPLAAIELLTPSALRLRAVGFTRPVMVGSDLQTLNGEKLIRIRSSAANLTSLFVMEIVEDCSQVRRRRSSQMRQIFKQLYILV